jgi:uncharacterized membrane protein
MTIPGQRPGERPSAEDARRVRRIIYRGDPSALTPADQKTADTILTTFAGMRGKLWPAIGLALVWIAVTIVRVVTNNSDPLPVEFIVLDVVVLASCVGWIWTALLVRRFRRRQAETDA